MIDTQIYQEIADNARAALDCPGVQVYLYNAARDELHVAAWSGLNLSPSKRAETMIRWFFPQFSPLEARNSGSINKYLIAAYHHGLTQVVPFTEIARNAAPPLAVKLASIFAGMHHTIIVPIKIDNVVVASISFSQTPKFTKRNVRTCEAFGRQTALLLENAQLSNTLSTQLHDLERSRKMLTENEERVRREISELLHTRVQTRLLVAGHRLGDYAGLEDEVAREVLIEKVRQELEEIREQDVRDASHMLHPAVIRMGLLPAVRSLAARLSEVLVVHVHCDERLIELDTTIGNSIPESLRLVAYRVIEEALSNTLRHAKASQAQVNLNLQNNLLEVRVDDNGCGFDTEQQKLGLGLSSLSARVLTAGGTWEISSRLSESTKLIARLPLVVVLENSN